MSTEKHVFILQEDQPLSGDKGTQSIERTEVTNNMFQTPGTLGWSQGASEEAKLGGRIHIMDVLAFWSIWI